MKKIEAVLFDLDGVLIDTEPLYTIIWSDINRAFPTGVENFALRIKGTTLPDILSTYFPDPEVSEGVKAMLQEREDAMPYPLFEGVTDFLEELQRAGIPAAIVTSSGADKMERLFGMIPGFRSYFADVITSARVTHSKPHPECYLTAAESLGANISRCVVFEDSYNGLESGRRSGARVVALATSNPAETLKDKADAVFDSIGLVSVEALEKLFGQQALKLMSRPFTE